MHRTTLQPSAFRLRPTLSAIALSALLVACVKEYPAEQPPVSSGGGSVYAKIYWDGLVPGDNLPARGMHVQLYPTAGGTPVGSPLPVHGGQPRLTPGASYASVCFDYAGMDYLDFRNMNEASLLEAYNEPVGGTYRTRVEAGREEPVVYESSPSTFYATREMPPFTVPGKGLDTVRYYPRNVLHEFTFMIHGVEGAEHVASTRGTVSGMSASYRLMSGTLSATPSTVMFRRAAALYDGRFPDGFNWNTAVDAVQPVTVPEFGVIPVYPKWFTPGWANQNTGWTGDWIIGAFSVFGLAAATGIESQLTIECLSHAGRSHSASWGYWQGAWDDSVTRQIKGALGYWDGCPANLEKGSPGAQTAWRQHNGGFDIILLNGQRLRIPTDVGLDAPVSDWDGGQIVPLNN